MAYMIRRNPWWRDQENWIRAMDRFFDIDSESTVYGFPIDLIENDKEYLVKASVAGFDPKKIDITYDNNTLSIKGEVEQENVKEEEGKYHVRERSYGSFYRSITMPGLVDQTQISADTENGILTVHLPKRPEAQPKKIEISQKDTKKIEVS